MFEALQWYELLCLFIDSWRILDFMGFCLGFIGIYRIELNFYKYYWSVIYNCKTIVNRKLVGLIYSTLIVRWTKLFPFVFSQSKGSTYIWKYSALLHTHCLTNIQNKSCCFYRAQFPYHDIIHTVSANSSTSQCNKLLRDVLYHCPCQKHCAEIY